MRKGRKFILAVAVAAVVGMAWGLNAWQKAEEEKPSVAWGSVDAREVALAFEAQGRIAALGREEGEAVKKGEPLGELDVRLLKIERKRARAALEGREADLRLAEEGYRKEEVAAAKASLLASESDLALARITETRVERLYRAQSASKQDYDDARWRRRTLERTRDAAKADYERLAAGLRPDEVVLARSARDAAKAELAALDYQIDHASRIVSPVEGVIRSRIAEVGDMASASRTVYRIAVMDPKWVRVYVSETQLGWVREGARATFFTDTTPPLEATVGYVSPEAEFTPKNVATNELRTMLVYEVRLNVKDPENRIRLGQPVTVDFAPERKDVSEARP